MIIYTKIGQMNARKEIGKINVTGVDVPVILKKIAQDQELLKKEEEIQFRYYLIIIISKKILL